MFSRFIHIVSMNLYFILFYANNIVSYRYIAISSRDRLMDIWVVSSRLLISVKEQKKAKEAEGTELQFRINLSQGLINTITVIPAFIPNCCKPPYSQRISMEMSTVVTWNM